jgi:hypothetical protein
MFSSVDVVSCLVPVPGSSPRPRPRSTHAPATATGWPAPSVVSTESVMRRSYGAAGSATLICWDGMRYKIGATSSVKSIPPSPYIKHAALLLQDARGGAVLAAQAPLVRVQVHHLVQVTRGDAAATQAWRMLLGEEIRLGKDGRQPPAHPDRTPRTRHGGLHLLKSAPCYAREEARLRAIGTS